MVEFLWLVGHWGIPYTLFWWAIDILGSLIVCVSICVAVDSVNYTKDVK